jgi:aminopeptidase N
MDKAAHGLRSGLMAAIVAGALMVGIPATAQAQGQACTPGASGIGDEYYPEYGNGGYDVDHYNLEIAYNPRSERLHGKATIDATATQSLCSFNLDLVGLHVRKIAVDGRLARHSRTEHELTVDPRQVLAQGSDFEVVIRYGGEPTEFAIPGFDIRTGFMDTPEGATVAGQPEVAAGWFPVNDHPLDKASYSFEVTVPDRYEVVANGFLRDTDQLGHRTTWEWEAREPMASYLATIDIADWDVHEWQTDDGLPVYDAVDTNITGGLRAEIDSSLSRQGEILDMLEDFAGPYPFSTVGAIVPNQDDLFFALETQTRPVYSKLFWLDGEGNPANADFVVVHELAHQWYGDDVAVQRWKDIWLNEGFATYTEWLWEEHEGRATPQEIFQATFDAIPADDPFWHVAVADPGVERLFDNQSYVRGAMTLQALRNEVGDADFFEIARQWAQSQSGGNGTTEEFMALAEQISGEQLDDLFDVWLFTAEKPPASATTAGVSSAAEPSAEARAASHRWLDDFQDRLRIGRY